MFVNTATVIVLLPKARFTTLIHHFSYQNSASRLGKAEPALSHSGSPVKASEHRQYNKSAPATFCIQINLTATPRKVVCPPAVYLMMAAETSQNPLLSTQKASDSGLQVALHPLVLLTISDYITRHTLRRQSGPVVGALLGQQNGREITIEHAFECHLKEAHGEVVLHEAWFEERLQQSKKSCFNLKLTPKVITANSEGCAQSATA